MALLNLCSSVQTSEEILVQNNSQWPNLNEFWQFFFRSGFALQCFICNNFDNPTGCGHGDEGKDQQFLKDCDDPQQNPDYDEASRDRIPLGAKYEFCRKIVTSIEFDVNTSKGIKLGQVWVVDFFSEILKISMKIVQIYENVLLG